MLSKNPTCSAIIEQLSYRTKANIAIAIKKIRDIICRAELPTYKPTQSNAIKFHNDSNFICC